MSLAQQGHASVNDPFDLNGQFGVLTRYGSPPLPTSRTVVEVASPATPDEGLGALAAAAFVAPEALVQRKHAFAEVTEGDYPLRGVVLHNHTYPFAKLVVLAFYGHLWSELSALTFEQHLELAFKASAATGVPAVLKEALEKRHAAYALMDPSGRFVEFDERFTINGTCLDMQWRLHCAQSTVTKMLVKEYGTAADASRAVFKSASSWATHISNESIVRGLIEGKKLTTEQLKTLAVTDGKDRKSKEAAHKLDCKRLGITICVRSTDNYWRDVRPHIETASKCAVGNKPATLVNLSNAAIKTLTKDTKVALYNAVASDKERASAAKKRAAREPASDKSDDNNDDDNNNNDDDEHVAKRACTTKYYQGTEFDDDVLNLAYTTVDTNAATSFSELLHKTAGDDSSDAQTQAQFEAVASSAPARFEKLFDDDEQDDVTKSMVLPLVMALVQPAAKKTIPADGHAIKCVPRVGRVFSDAVRRKVLEAASGTPLDWLRRNQPNRFGTNDVKLRFQEQILSFGTTMRLCDPVAAQLFADEVDNLIEQMVHNNGCMPTKFAQYEPFAFAVQQFGFTEAQVLDCVASLKK